MSARAACLWLFAALFVCAHAQPVAAQAPAAASSPAEVLVVLASNTGEGSDPQLDKIEALRKAPFDSFSRKSLLKRVELKLELGKETEIELPNGRKLRLVWLEKLKDGRLRVSLSINRTGQRDYLPVMTVAAAPGDLFFVAGQRHEGGTLIIGVRVGK